MSIMNRAKSYARVLRHMAYVNQIQNGSASTAGRLLGEIIRDTHSIEKGLSLDAPKKFFGLGKIERLLEHIKQYGRMEGHSTSAVLMGVDAVEQYVAFHGQESDDERIRHIAEQIHKLKAELNIADHDQHGGTTHICRTYNPEDYENLKALIERRHSIRDFSGEPVPDHALRKALSLALRCPTACNRQAVRAHVLSGKKKELLRDWVSGIGGFEEKVDRYIIITGKISEYRADEPFQYVVSASIFAGYLSLALEACGIGACIIQRPVLRTRQWEDLQGKMGADEDEQIVLMLGVGMLKQEYDVPVSFRLPYDEMVTELS